MPPQQRALKDWSAEIQVLKLGWIEGGGEVRRAERHTYTHKNIYNIYVFYPTSPNGQALL